MKILYHHRTMGDGAEGIHIAEMVNAFRELGHEVLVAGPAKERNLEKSDQRLNLSRLKKLIKGPNYELLELGYNFYNYISLSKIVKSYKPDLIYDRYITFNYSSVAFGKLKGIPVFLEVNAPLAYERDNEKDEFLHLKKVAYFIEKKVCNDSFKTIVVSTPLRDYLRSVGVSEKKILVLPNGVNPNKFKPQSESIKLKEELGLLDHDIVIGFVGILRPWHGIDLLIQAVQQISAHLPNVKLLLVGDGPIKNDIVRMAINMGISQKIVITGRVPHENVGEYVSLFDVAVSPKATFYASPMKIPEYMAQGKPVVAPNTRNIKDIISDGEEGILFVDGDRESLSNALQSLIANNLLRKQLGKSALVKAQTQLCWQQNAKVVLKELL